MDAPVVDVRALRKVYRVTERETGLAATFRSLVRRRYREVLAVDGITFHIDPGEVVGFLGPNGAGKTTTLKMLSGLLYPTGGEATVLGHVPWRREGKFLRAMTLLMGNRSQLVWDIPAADSFLVLKEIYAVPDAQYKRTLVVWVTLAFWFVRVENLLAIFWAFTEAGRFPVDVYPLWLRVSLSTIVPIGIAVTAPANVIAGRMDWIAVAMLGAGTVLAVGFASALWRWGLRSYTGASA